MPWNSSDCQSVTGRSRTGWAPYACLLAVLAAVACADTTGPGDPSGPGDPNGPGETGPDQPAALHLDSIRLTPVVTTPGEPFTLSIRVTGASGPVLSVRMNEDTGLLYAGKQVDSLVLRDDGTQGDERAADHWFTVDGLVLPLAASGVAATGVGGFSWIHEPGVARPDSFYAVTFSFRTADPAVTGSPPLLTLANDARATFRVVNIVRPVGSLDEAAVAGIVRRYYDLFPDDRDFLVVLMPPSPGGGWSARAFQVRNHTRGLGLALADWRDYGSDSRLQLVVEARPDLYSVRDGKGNFCLPNHELTHRWAAYVGAPLADASSHWRGGVLDRSTSALGDSVGCVHNDLELYLAGLLPADSVVDRLSRDGYTMAQLIAAHGARVPAYGDAPRDFTIGFIVASQTPLTDHALAYFHYIAGEYVAPHTDLGVNWSMATGGQSALIDGIAPLGSGPTMSGKMPDDTRADRGAGSSS